MTSALFLDIGSHLEFLALVADEIAARGGRAWIANLYPRGRAMVRALAPGRLVPEPLSWNNGRAIDRLPDDAAPWLDDAAADAIVRVVRAAAPHPLRDDDTLDARLRRRVQGVAAWFHEFLAARDVDVVLCWNGASLPTQCAAAAARALGRATLFVENGFFPRTMQLDPEGVNVGATIARLPGAWFDDVEVDDAAWRRTLDEVAHPPRAARAPRNLNTLLPWWRRRAHTLSDLFNDRLASRRRATPELPALSPRASLRRARLLRDARATPPVAPPDRPFLLVPLQVATDTQITLHSPYVPTMDRLVELAAAARGAVAPDLPIVVKEHPKDPFAAPAAEARFAADVTWMRGGDLRALLPRAAAVMTVNSTVGVEALIAGVPVVTLGRAFFNKEGIVHHAPAPADVAPALEAALRGPRDDARIRRFLHYLRETWLVPAHPRHLDPPSIAAAADAIIARAAAAREEE